jgi:condensation domain-containing protein
MQEGLTVQQAVAALESKGVRLFVVDGRLQYTGPKGCGQSQELLWVRQRAREVLSYLTANHKRPESLLPLGAYVRENPAPLTHMQRWWIELEEQVGQNRHPVLVIEMKSEMQVFAWQRAFNEVVRRHEALRTRFVRVGTNVVSVVDPAAAVPMAIHDCAHDAAGPQRERVGKLLDAAHLERYEIIGGTLFRASLVKLGEQSHLAVLGVHHALYDGWSAEILRKELLDLYAAFAAGLPSPLSEPRVQLADYAVWERRWLTADPCGHWEARLSAVVPMELPSDAPWTRSIIGHPEAIRHFSLPPESVAELRRFSGECGVSLSETLLAIYILLLGKWANRADVLMGNYMACRATPGVEELLGCFASNRPMYVAIDWEWSVSRYMEQVHASYLEALDVRRPVSMRIAWAKGLNRVVANFAWLNDNVSDSPLGSQTSGSLPVNHELSLMVVATKSALFGAVSYASDLYSAARIAGLCDDFCDVACRIPQSVPLRIADVVTSLPSRSS